jgi:hypothetical protein
VRLVPDEFFFGHRIFPLRLSVFSSLRVLQTASDPLFQPRRAHDPD